MELTHTEALYKVYTDHKRGSLNSKLWVGDLHTVPEHASLADVIDSQDDLQIITRLDAHDDLDADDDNSDDDDDDDIDESEC